MATCGALVIALGGCSATSHDDSPPSGELETELDELRDEIRELRDELEEKDLALDDALRILNEYAETYGPATPGDDRDGEPLTTEP